MRVLASLLFPALALACVGYFLILPAMETIGQISHALTVAGLK